MDLNTFLRDAATPSLIDVMEAATSRADALDTSTRLVHLVTALLDDSTVRARVPADIAERLRAALAPFATATPGAEGVGAIAFDLQGLIGPAMTLARDWGADRVAPLTLLAACLAGGPLADAESARVQEALRHEGLNVETLMPQRSAEANRRADFTCKALGYGTDLTAMARAGVWPACPLIGQEAELLQLVMSVASGTDSVVIVGEPGVGKSALLQGLAWHLVNGTRPLIPPDLDGHTIVALSPMNVLAGTGGRGELEERLEHMLTFFRTHPHVVPFFDEIHSLLDADDAQARTVATAIKPPMVNGLFRCIGATTDKEYARFIASDEAMNSRFTRVLLTEPDEDATVRIVSGVRDSLLSARARELGVTLTSEAIRSAVRLTTRYKRSDRQPRKTMQLLARVAAKATYRLQIGEPDATPEVGADLVSTVFSERERIPVDEIDDTRADFYMKLGERLGQRVKGQPFAIEAVTGWLALQASGWLDGRRPRGRFLFLGPPGVGKTELATALAAEVLRDRGSVIVKSMAEFKGEGARTRFMGADPGYVGFGQTSTVYSDVMMRPYSVVLLDEFEKAHASLADPMISVLDGKAADGQARTVDFAQCIFIMTSNAIQVPPAELFLEQDLREMLVGLGGVWTAPLVDRIDRIVLFQALDEEVLLEILDGMIAARRRTANRPLPTEIGSIDARRQILAWAMEGEATPSARRLERALLRWLSTVTESVPFRVE